MQNKPMVSVYMLAYNHQNYIRKALESIVAQKTDFPFEIIVHDDASTDSTADIIRELEGEFPHIIKPIYQTENQYSKKIAIFSEFIFPVIKGKYIACCEGDDYWIDEKKLQKQVDYMENHPDCTFCFTNGLVEDQTGKTPTRKFIPFHEEEAKYYADEDMVVTLDEAYRMSFVPTASFMMRADSFLKLPESYKESCACGDLKNRLFHTALGYGYYMKDVTCVYRYNVPGSALTRWKADSRETAYWRYKRICKMLENVDVFTEYRHTEGLWHFKESNIKVMLLNAPSFKTLLDELKDENSKKAFYSLAFGERVKIFAKAVLPECVVAGVKRLKNKR